MGIHTDYNGALASRNKNNLMIRNVLLTIILLLGSLLSIAHTSLVPPNAIISDSVSQSGKIKVETVLKDSITDNSIVYPESMSEEL